MHSAKIYTDVVLPLPLQQDFTYHVPDELISAVQVGKRVIVQFGNRKLYTALVKRVHSNVPEYETKPIEVVLDEFPIIGEQQFPFWEWMAQYYLCSEGEVMKAALPSGLKLESQTQIVLNTEWEEENKLTPLEETIYQFIYNNHTASIQQINKLTRRSNAYPLIKSLLNKGAVQVDEQLETTYRQKTLTYLKISDDLAIEANMEKAFEQLKRAKKQEELLMWLLNEMQFYAPNKMEAMAKKTLAENSSFSESLLKGLIQKGYVESFEVEVDRLADTLKTSDSTELNAFQATALNDIKTQFSSKNVCLLHGVTASGKTEIYIQLIEEQLKAGKQVLYLLPEIALTSQIIDRLTAIFGNKAGIYHSRFNDMERVEIWNKVLEFTDTASDKYQLILGARSALFLPFKNLGLIIIDEEHETSFKQQDPAPRYHARDAAIMLAKFHDAKVLLGTATPSFESYFNAKTNKYGLVELTQRHHDVALPEIVIADLTDAYKRKQMKSYFTPVLFEYMQEALANNEQIILFQNRRGFSSFIQCRSCGWIPKCKHCDVSLTYHKFQHVLLCHYCGYSVSLPSECGHCHSSDIQTKGFGTEKVEDELKILFPDIKIGRLDVDSTRKKFGYEKVMHKFKTGKTQILVGTQMITKGLDFEHVNVVGILNADNLLNFPDFRSYERAFQLMAQVSGRAGRKNKQGKVVIQTSQPDNPVVHLVKENNFEGMFNRFIQERKTFKYPPWYRLIYLTIKHKNRDRTILASRQLATELRKTFQHRVLGPEFHLISRMQQYYQVVIRIKLEKTTSPKTSKKSIVLAIDTVKKLENNRSVIIVTDVDPF
ncbi:MAG: primosomal protein N' [Prolixibacteraceae bacterium]